MAVAAAFGAGLIILLFFRQPRVVLQFMRVIEPRGDAYLLLPELAWRVPVTFIVIAMAIAAGTVVIRLILRRVGITTPIKGGLAVIALAFAAGFIAETLHQIIDAHGNLTASDSAGDIINGGELTPHGWNTIARRSAVLALYVGLIGGSFALARRILR